jgi:ATP-dependent Clp protease protease subunit
MVIQKEHEHMQPSAFLVGYAETYVKLAKHRIIFISEDISNDLASELSALLLHFDNEDHSALIEIYINSHGGDVSGLFNICDVMQIISAPIRTICAGCAYSAAAVILSSGSKGERCAFKHSRIMIHGIQCVFPIPGFDMNRIKNYHDFMLENNDNIMKILADNTKTPLEKIRKDCNENVWMTPQMALEYGIIDRIL